jgi:hypothetical protein
LNRDQSYENRLTAVGVRSLPSTVTSTTPPATLLAEANWLERRRGHEARVDRWIEPHRQRASRGEKHPVEDFLFSYYSFRASLLRRWHPGPDVVLAGENAREFLRWSEYQETADGVQLNLMAIPEKRRALIEWLRDYLRVTGSRTAFFGCFGWHEWAMVYRQTPAQVRHNTQPLRFGPEEIARIVESGPRCCTHFDAFRFFTDPARPLNRHQPIRESVKALDQRGCLHVNMDLYKWASKLSPYCPSELMADCFTLARDIREIDMRASPYDLRQLGYAPIAIETVSGRSEYELAQREFARRSEPLRHALGALCDRLLVGPS